MGHQDADKKLIQGLFFSNVIFMNDLAAIPKKVDHSLPKKDKLEMIKSLLNDINKQLPSFVYVPSDGSLPSPPDIHLKRMIIAKIETDETKIFPTKTKTNFSCCFQLISPEEYLMRNYYSYRDNREKIIHNLLAKFNESLAKQNSTPASLLVRSNIATQFSKSISKKSPQVLDRFSDMPAARYDKTAFSTRSRPR